MDHNIILPFTDEVLAGIRPMDVLYLTGTVYTARDAAHRRMYETVLKTLEESGIFSVDDPGSFTESAVETGRAVLPFDILNSVVYYLGPTPPKPGQVIGSAGPTTSGRMDKYTPLLLKLGMRGMIGKGRRSGAVIDAIHENKAIYMGATGGAGALLSKCIKSSEIIAYDDLGTEAIRKLYVENFPVTVLEV